MLDHAQKPSPLKRQLYGATGLTLLIVLYLLPGSIGHDPWRGDDVGHFGAIHAMLQGDGILFPAIAGEPLTRFGPLYYWVGAVFATVFGWLLPLHDASRLATPFFAGLAIFWTARTASRLYGRHTRTAAALLTLGTLGLVVHAHEHQPMIALMTMQAMTLAGLALVPTQPVKGSIQAATGVALAFLTAGPTGLLLTVPLFLIITAISPECRNPRASGALILGLSLGLSACVLWPLALNMHAPDHLSLWLEDAWVGFAANPLRPRDLARALEMAGWFVWPLWPIGLWTLWRLRHQMLRLPLVLPIATIVLVALAVYASGDLDQAALLPLVVPCALLAAAGVPTLRRGAANAFDWFAVMTFGVFGLTVWLAWTAQVFFWPPGLARSLDRMAPDFVLTGTLIQAWLGAGICLAWAALVWRLPRSPNRGPANWAMGMTMLWCLAVTLLLPWIDHGRSYRQVAESLTIALAGEERGCVAAMGLATSHKASFDYFSGLRTEKVIDNETSCRYLLAHDDVLPVGVDPDRQWQQIWEYRHGGGKRLEVFRLYRRD